MSEQPEQYTHNKISGPVTGSVVQAGSLHLHVALVLRTLFDSAGNNYLHDALSGVDGHTADGDVPQRREALVDALVRFATENPDEISSLIRSPGVVEAGARPLASGFEEALDLLVSVDQRLSEQRIAQQSQTDATERVAAQLLQLQQQVAEALRQELEPEPADGRCPYPGLQPFDTEQADLFFGRKDLVATLVSRLPMQLARGNPLFVVGVSGAGKSSLLKAGLAPAIDHGDLRTPGTRTWGHALFRPGATPMQELRESLELDEAAQRSELLAAAHGTVVIVDQFEEIFTQCSDADERSEFLEVLRAMPLVVLGLRADFFPMCQREPLLAEVLQDNQLHVGPMTHTELTEAVEKPAQVVGLRLEEGLVRRVLEDVGAFELTGRRYPPGALPLMGYALQATWKQCAGGSLTLAAYEAAGGVRGAVTKAAEDIFAELTHAERKVLRRMMLQLVTVGEGGETARRRVHTPVLAGDPTAEKVLEKLVRARLVTMSEQQVEISHEALLRAWWRLADWLADECEGLPMRSRIADAAQAWLSLGRDHGSLYRGAQLNAARRWLEDDEHHRDDLGPLELQFVDLSIAEQEQAQERERARTRLFRRLTFGLASVLAIALAAGSVAAVQWRRADVNRDEAVSRQFAAESVSATSGSPRRAVMLALRAWQTAPTAEARGALLSANMLSHNGLIGENGGRSVAVSPDGGLVAIGGVGGGNKIDVWRTDNHQRLDIDLSGHTKPVGTTTFSPDAKILATASPEAGGVRLWEMPGGRPLQQLHGGLVAAWRPDGGAIASVFPGPSDGWHLTVWEKDSWRPIADIPIGGSVGELPMRIAYHPKEKHIAVSWSDGTIAVWREDGSKAWARSAHAAGVVSLAWSPDGNTLATGGITDGKVRFWNAATGEPTGDATRQETETSTFSSLAYTPDGIYLMAADGGGALRMWAVQQQVWGSETIGTSHGTAAIAISADGYTMAMLPSSGPTTLWRRDRRWLSWQSGAVIAVGFSPDGAVMTAAGVGGVVRSWDTGNRDRRWTIGQPGIVTGVAHSARGVVATNSGDTVVITGPHGEHVTSLKLDGLTVSGTAFSSDGALLAVTASEPLAEKPATVTTWDTTTWQRRDLAELDARLSLSQPAFTPNGSRLVLTSALSTLDSTGAVRKSTIHVLRGDLTEERTMNGGTEQLPALAISPDGGTLATGGADRQVSLWNLATGERVRQFGQHPTVVRSVAFSPSGKELATASGDSIARLWDLASGNPIAVLNGHVGVLNEVAWAADSTTLATAGTDGQVGVWDLDTDRVHTRLCQAISGPGLDEEWRTLGIDPATAPCH